MFKQSNHDDKVFWLQSTESLRLEKTLRSLSMSYEIQVAWTNLLPPVNSRCEPALEPSSGLQKCFISESAGADPAGGARLDGCLILIIWLLLFPVFF